MQKGVKYYYYRQPTITIRMHITDVGESVGVSVRVDNWQNVPVILIDQPYGISVTTPCQLRRTHSTGSINISSSVSCVV